MTWFSIIQSIFVQDSVGSGSAVHSMSMNKMLCEIGQYVQRQGFCDPKTGRYLSFDRFTVIDNLPSWLRLNGSIITE